MLGHGHGYANGGIISEPIIGTGLRSGAKYSFGENGPETVTPGINRVHGGGNVYVINVETSAFDTDATAVKIVQSIRRMKKHHGGQSTGIG